MPIFIRNAQVYAPESRGVNNVLIEGGRILSVSSGAAGLEGELLETIDAQGRWLLPGFVDVLTRGRFREPHPGAGGG
jgi:predicted amidohydrolase YtcJ